MTLETDIKNHIDAAAPPISLEEIISASNAETGTTLGNLTTARRGTGGDQRRRWAPSLLVGATAVVLGVAAVVTTDLFGQGDLVVTTDIQVDYLVAGIWEQVADLDRVFVPSDVVETIETSDGNETGISQISVSRIAATDDGYVAVGSESVGFAEVAAVWSTSDGQTWTRVAAGSPAFGEPDLESGDLRPTGHAMTDVAASGETTVAVGRQHGDTVVPTAWRSVSNGDWERVALPIEEPGFYSSLGVVSTSAGFVAVGNHNRDFDTGRGNRTLIWLSRDGLQWTRVSDPGFDDGEAIRAIETFGDRVVAVGTSGGFNKPSAAAWISDNAGQTWTRAILPAAPDDRPVTSMVDVAVGPEGLVAIGHQAISGDTSWQQNHGGPRTLSDQQDIVVWSSPDGSEWRQSGELRSPNQITIDPSITAGPGGYLISFTTITTETIEVSTWITTNGSQLDEIDYPGGRSLGVTLSTEDRYVSITKRLAGGDGPMGSEQGKALQVWQLSFN